MKRTIFSLLTLLSVGLGAQAQNVTLKLVETSDVHGCFLEGMNKIYDYVEQLRGEYPGNVILLENGDILQGQPIAAYYNYVATDEMNIAAQITNFMGYDVQCFGNHDIETGHAVYDKWVSENSAPTLGANIVRSSGAVYTTPYIILERAGARVCVLGMLTPAIPNWLNEPIWSGLQFEELVESARKWVEYIKANEDYDLLIGLFHSGYNGGIITEDYAENATLAAALEVEGFDAIFYGHDHRARCEKLVNKAGKDVWVLNPANNAQNVSELTVELTKAGGKWQVAACKGEVVSIKDRELNPAFSARFAEAGAKVKAYVEEEIGVLKRTLYTRDAFFGSNPFIDMINQIQLDLTGAEISISAPLGYNTIVNEGVLTVGNMFEIYRFENLLCTVEMSGQELKDHLEHSYGIWTSQVKGAGEHVMNIEPVEGQTQPDGSPKYRFIEPTYNFDSALGIDYLVDVTQPAGNKVIILQMSNGEPFELERVYRVAMNSYRANNLHAKVIWQSDRDLRHYITEYFRAQGEIEPKAANNWRFVPETVVTNTLITDKKLIFGQ